MVSSTNVSRPTMGLDADTSYPNMGLGADVSWPSLELGAEKDITLFWVVILVCWLLNGKGFRKLLPISSPLSLLIFEKIGRLRKFFFFY
jgi:hypothetical protein